MGTKSKDWSAVLFPATKRKILALFFLNQDQEYYFSEVVRLTGTRQGVIQRELHNLAEAGILISEKRGRQRFYSVNRKHPIFRDLRNVIFKTFGMIGKIRESLESLEDRIKIALVYGSFARGTEVGSSDIDLFIIGNVHLSELVRVLSKVEKSLGREINPTLFSVREYRDKILGKNHFLTSLAKSEKEFIIGSEDELRRLAE